ncbi:MAG TPA: DUF1501 domain-containing protein [Myxococcaceae bacterium]|nr:DUF1501 domain-containing protein [Myxococcaceae bacterium]
MKVDRRFFLKSSGLAMLGLGFAPGFLSRAVAARTAANKKILLAIFQRGGADGLSMVPPVGDPEYYALRPTLAIARPGEGEGAALKLDDTFGLHPALSSLAPLYQAGALAIVHAVGSPKPTRSHFDAQDFMEGGIPGALAPDGWLNRALQNEAANDPRAFRAVALQSNLPRSLFGSAPAVAMGSVAEFKLRTGRLSDAGARSFEALYASAVDVALRNTGNETFEALRLLEKAKLDEMPVQHGADYPNSPLGRRLQDVARLIRADIGLEVAATDCGGWDTHVGQGAAQGQLAARLKELGDSLAAFAVDLGDRMADVCVVTMTEFGRTVRENGNRGTDHGTASLMFVMGGGVRGRRVIGQWRGLREPNLFEGRDLAMATDFRAVLSEILASHLGISRLAPVFPGFDAAKASLHLFNA